MKNTMKKFLFIALLIICFAPTQSHAESTTSTESSGTEIQNTTSTNPGTQASNDTTSVTNNLTQENQTLVTETTTSTTTTSVTETTTSTLSETISTTTAQTSSSTTSINLHLRYLDTLFFDGPVVLNSGKITVTDSTNTQHEIPANSALGILTKADVDSETFTVSNLAYYASFNSFLVNCITIQNTSEPACYNWQYVVNDTYPFVGADSYLLNQNDDVYFYFGSQHRLTLPTSTIQANQSITAQAEVYQYKTNTYSPLLNVTVGATQPDPTNPWSPKVVSSTITNTLGQATIFLSTTGTYNFGIAEDYYFPTVPLTVVEATTLTTTTSPTQVSESVSTNTGSGGSPNTLDSLSTTDKKIFAVDKAIAFLDTEQNKTTGAIGTGSLFSDWSAIALGSYGQNTATKDLLAQYLKTDPNPGTSATDWERRAMALMALGINPYSGTKTDYITNIMETYTNNQFGDVTLINDDIFALFPLLKAGYTADDKEIKNSVQFILTRQLPNGAWESPDLTAAAIQSLSQVTSLPGVPEALTKAKQYLKIHVKSDGRIGDNTFSTSWGIQAIFALGEQENDWKLPNGATPSEYLANQQNTDGGMETSSVAKNDRIWSTAYAIPAILHKPWSNTLVSFNKPTTIQNQTTTNNTSSPSASFSTPSITTPTSTVTSSLPVAIITTSSTITETTIPVIKNPVASVPEITVPTINSPTSVPNELGIPNTYLSESESSQTTNNQPNVKTQNISVAGNQAADTPPANPIDPTQPTLTAPQNTIPGSTTAKSVFGGAAAVAGTLGVYLAWRFVQNLL